MSDVKQLAIKAMTTWSGCRNTDGTMNSAACLQAHAEETALFIAIEELHTQLLAQKLALACIFRACGFVEDGSGQAVAIFQDDAIRDWCFTAGNVNLYASSKSELVSCIVEHYAPNGTLP